MSTISFYNRFFYPDISATSQILTELVIGLRDKGLSTKVVCSDYLYTGGRVTEEYRIEGIIIDRISSTNLGKSSKLARYSDFISFIIAASGKILFDRSKLFIFFTDPPLINLIGSLLTYVKNKKVIVVLQDFFPYAAASTSMVNNSLLIKILDESTIYSLNRVDKVVVLSEQMLEFAINKGVKKDRIVLIHNWADGGLIIPDYNKSEMFLAKFGIRRESFVVLYTGNMGIGHEFDTIMNVIKELHDVEFVFVGDGVKRSYIEKRAKEENLKNVRLSGYVKKEELSELLSIADLTLLTQIENVVGLNMPSKLYSYMAAGKPICYIGAIEGDVSRILKQSGCGNSFKVGDVAGVTKYIRELKKDNETKKSIGLKGRKFFEQNFDKNIAIDKYYSLIKDVLDN